MAENIDELQRQLADAMRRAQEDYARYGQLQTTTSQQLFDAQMKQKLGSESATKGLNTMGQALGAVAGAGIESAKVMYQGKKDATAFNASLGELAKAATLAGTALTLLMPGGFIMKGIITAVTMFTGAVLATVQAANEMNAKLYKGYEGLAKSGAAASDGMTGVFKDAKKLGLSMDQLDSYVGLVTENSQELALFAGSVAGGRKKFADMGEALESSRVGFFAMGISQQEQNEGMMRFTKTMTQAGRAQNMTSKELADGARSYIMEQDKLAKLTGISAQKQQALLDRARENEQFNAKIRALELEGTAESKAAADGLRKGLIIAAAAGDDAAEGFMASVNGNLRNEKARELNMTAQGEQMRSIQNILNGMDPAQAMQPMFKSMANFEKTVGIPLNQLGAGAGVFLKTSTMANAANLATMDVAEMSAKIDKDTALQRKGAGDAMTGEEARQIKERQDLNKKAEEAIFGTIQNAQAVNAKLLGTTDGLIDAFGRLTKAVNSVLNFFGLGPEVTVEQKQTEVTGAEQKLSAAIEAQKTAKTPAEKQQADQDRLFYEEKVKNLKLEKMNLIIAEDNALYEKEVLKRAEIDAANKKAAYAKTMESATAGQKIGIGRTDMQKEAFKANQEAETKLELLKRSSESGVSARAASVEQLKSTGYKPPASERRQSSSAASSTTQTPGQGLEIKSQQDLEKMGLKIKQGDVQAKDAGISTKLIDMAKEIQNQVPGFSHFSGFNDKFHQEKSPSSKHTQGLAADFAVTSDPTPQAGKEIADMLRKMGASYVQDEYNNKSAQATAGHFHVEVPTFADGGYLAEGKLGIAGEAGPEFVQGPASITPMGDITGVFNNMAMMIGQQTGAIEELIRIAKNGNDIQTKILRQQA